jgi:hypothetical protein
MAPASMVADRDVVDDRQQRVGGNRDGAGIFALLFGEQAEAGSSTNSQSR